MEDYKDNNKYAFLIKNLIEDVLDLLPQKLRNQLLKKYNLELIKEGAFSFDLHEPSSTNLMDLITFGKQASFVAIKFYGSKELIKKPLIPEIVYYNGFNNDCDFENRIRKGMSELVKSRKKRRDKYNLALSIITDMWIINFINSGQAIKKFPPEGVYLRDFKGRLYSYREA